VAGELLASQEGLSSVELVIKKIRSNFEVKFTAEQAKKAQTGSGGIHLLFL
jgi:hypothetical protein